MKRWMAVLLLILLPACACADVITAAGSYQACRENGEGEYLVLTREGTGAKATAYDGQDEYL